MVHFKMWVQHIFSIKNKMLFNHLYFRARHHFTRRPSHSQIQFIQERHLNNSIQFLQKKYQGFNFSVPMHMHWTNNYFSIWHRSQKWSGSWHWRGGKVWWLELHGSFAWITLIVLIAQAINVLKVYHWFHPSWIHRDQPFHSSYSSCSTTSRSDQNIQKSCLEKWEILKFIILYKNWFHEKTNSSSAELSI